VQINLVRASTAGEYDISIASNGVRMVLMVEMIQSAEC
jgi:hypothetical protein